MLGRLLIGCVVLVAVAAPAVVGQFAVSSSKNLAYENALAACERGNAVRSVVFTNTRNAAEQSRKAGDPPEITAVFVNNLHTLLAVPGTDPDTGEVDCAAVIEAP